MSPTKAIAQQKVQINEVIIQAKSADSSLLNEQRSTDDIHLLSHQEIHHNSSKGIGDVIRQLPGILVQGPPLAYRNAKMLGLDKEFQTILINGSRPAGGEDRREIKLDRLPSSLVESVEVRYNPTVKWGGYSTVGSINVKTKSIPDQFTQSLKLSGDLTSTHKGIFPVASYFIGNRFKKWGYYAYGGYSSHERVDQTKLTETTTDISGYSNEVGKVNLSTLSSRLYFQPNAKHEWMLDALFSYQKDWEDLLANVTRRSKGGLVLRADSAAEVSIRQMSLFKLSHHFESNSLEGDSKVRFETAYLTKDKDRLREKDFGWERSAEIEEQNISKIMANTDWMVKPDVASDSWFGQLQFGAEGSYTKRNFDRFAYARQANHLFWDEAIDASYDLSLNYGSAYLSQSFSLGKAEVEAGVRLRNTFHYYATVDTVGSTHHLALLPAVHIKRELLANGPTIRLAVSAQHADQPYLYLVPVRKVKHKKEIIEVGNPELLPSRAWNASVSLDQAIHEHSRIKIRAFSITMRDLVEMKFLGLDEQFAYRVFQPVNIEQAHVYGSSIEFRTQLSNTIGIPMTIWGNYSWNGSSVIDPITDSIRMMNDQAKHLVKLQADLLLTRLNTRISGGYYFTSQRSTVGYIQEDGTAIPGFYYEGFSQFDVAVKYYFRKWGSVSFNVHNLTNEKLKLHQSTVTEELELGRLYRLSLSIDF